MRPLRVLFVEDVPDDVMLLLIELRHAGYEVTWERVESAEAMKEALARPWDMVLSDYTMPRFSAPKALAVLKASAQAELPFLIVSGSIGEESAIDSLKAGAADFIIKNNLARLVPAIERELGEAQMRRERREALEALEQAIRARDDFLSIASHELKTPLTTLRLQVAGLLRAAESARMNLAEDKVRSRLGSIARSAERLAELVDRMLDVTRITTGRLELDREEVDLVAVMREVVADLELGLDGARPTIGVRAGVPVTGRWDRQRIEAVVTNLLTNAIKYGEKRPIEVTLEDLGASARLVVVDHGIGIAEADQRRIFERFERAVPEQHFGGFGIGLWLSRQIVEAHGGRIKVSSRPGEGSRFEIELPKGEGGV
ncbi:MAG TPA: HAMP domain-containing sensor histidine kinase [Polyangia bacterium]|jgi:signal transduction histidine kinase|nr:HAMP domain-containing sensor histidine kinase [Polyangia bacterium]